MDKEALRKEIYEELHSQYEAKLKEAKKQKALVEEELESSSEKWRAERRRLNAEVDRLESALADGRDARRKASDTKTTRSADTQETAKAQAAADENLKKATRNWDAERSKLEGEISRLQRGVAELLERANNPMRASQSARELLETNLEEAVKAKRQTEDAFLEAKAEWEKEKLKLAGEMIKLRRSVGQGKAPKGDAPEEDRSKEKELAKQLEEAARKREALERDLQKAQNELERRIAEAKDSTDKAATARLQKQIEEAANTRQALERDLKTAQQEAVKLNAEIERLTAQLATIRDAAAKEYAGQIERERAETARVKEALERDLQKAQQEIARLKEERSTDLERQSVQLEESQKAHARIRELERRIAEAKDSAGKETADRLEKELAETASARQTLERDLKKAQQEAAQLKEKQTEELRRATARLQESQTEIRQLQRQLEETRETVSVEVVEQLRRQYDERLQEMIRQKTQLSEQLNSASALLEAERSRFAAAAAAQSKAEPDKQTASGPTIATDTLNAELARVKSMIEGIARLIDNPDTELSTVIRKNVERAELDAYLKGILFSLGRSRGL